MPVDRGPGAPGTSDSEDEALELPELATLPEGGDGEGPDPGEDGLSGDVGGDEPLGVDDPSLDEAFVFEGGEVVGLDDAPAHIDEPADFLAELGHQDDGAPRGDVDAAHDLDVGDTLAADEGEYGWTREGDAVGFEDEAGEDADEWAPAVGAPQASSDAEWEEDPMLELPPLDTSDDDAVGPDSDEDWPVLTLPELEPDVLDQDALDQDALDPSPDDDSAAGDEGGG